MFSRICIPAQQPHGKLFDLGLIAESLLFYEEVCIIVRPHTLAGLLKQVEPTLLLELMSAHNLRVRYTNRTLVGVTHGKDTSRPVYSVAIIGPHEVDMHDLVGKMFMEALGKSGRGRRLANRFLSLAQPISYRNDILLEVGEDLRAERYLGDYLRRKMEPYRDSQGGGDVTRLVYRFRAVSPERYVLETNLDAHHLHSIGDHVAELRDPASVLAYYGATIGEASLWAEMSSEAAVDPRTAEILQSRVEPLLARRAANEERISTFQEFTFGDARALREAINEGRKSLSDMLDLLRHARKFKQWLAGKDATHDLIKAYYSEVTKGSWLDKLPAKVLRWSLFTGAGLCAEHLGGPTGLGTAAGIGVTILDGFFLDRLVKGWRPHSFVHGALGRFLK